jgi:hypothetical protein
MELSSRYANDGKAILPLNPLQLQNIEKVNDKLKANQYRYENIDCAVCNKRNFESISEKDRYGFRMDVVVCQICGLVQTNPRMNQESYNKFYNTEYRSIYIGTEKPTEDFFNRQRLNIGRKIFDFITAHTDAADLKDKFVFEIGCGAGGILKFFEDKGCRVKGIDLGEEYLEYGRMQHGLDLEVGSLSDFVLRLKDKPDIIIYSHVLEHILNLEDQLSLVRKIMHPETLLYIEVPGLRNLHQTYENDLLFYLQNAHVYHFTKTSLLNVMAKNRFDVLICNEYVRGVFKISQNENSAIVNEYPQIMHYLKRVERIRTLFPIPPYRIKHLTKQLIYQLLAFFKLVPALEQNKKWNYDGK